MKKGIICIAITTFLFSTMEIVLKTVSDVFDPIQLNFLRFIIGGLVLLPFALKSLKKRNIRLKPRDLVPFIWLGFIGITVSMTLFQFSVAYTDASVVAVLLSSNPLFVCIFAFIFLREPVRKRNIIALALDILGIICIIAPWKIHASLAGEILIMISTVIFALYGVFGTKYSKMYGGVVNTCFSALAGGIILMFFAAATNIPFIGNALTNAGLDMLAYIPFINGISLSTLPQFLYVCIFVTGVGYACYFMAMEETSANMTSLVFFFKPILAPILALLILHEIPMVNRFIGIGLILIASLCNVLPPLLDARRERKNTEHSE